MEAETVGVGPGDEPESEQSSPPPPPKVDLDEMIKLLGEEAGHNEIMADFLRGRPNCDHRRAERKALVFQRALMTLELMKLHQAAFTALLKSEMAKGREAAKQTASKPRTGGSYGRGRSRG